MSEHAYRSPQTMYVVGVCMGVYRNLVSKSCVDLCTYSSSDRASVHTFINRFWVIII